MSGTDLRYAYHALKLVSDSENYYGIYYCGINFYGITP